MLAFPLSTAAVWVDIRLDEADVALDDGANVPHPMFGALDVGVDGTRFETTGLRFEEMRLLTKYDKLTTRSTVRA